MLQACAVGVVVAYHQVPAVQEASKELERVKAPFGWTFAAVVTALASVVLPELAKLASQRRAYRLPKLGDTLYLLGFFAIIGTVVDTQYRLLGVWPGPGRDFGTLLIKFLVDQGLSAMLFGGPFSASAMLFMTYRYRWYLLVGEWRNRFYVRRAMPVVLLIWPYWGPIVVCLYMMPTDLQFWVFLFAQGAYSLLLVGMQRVDPAPTAS